MDFKMVKRAYSRRAPQKCNALQIKSTDIYPLKANDSQGCRLVRKRRDLFGLKSHSFFDKRVFYRELRQIWPEWQRRDVLRLLPRWWDVKPCRCDAAAARHCCPAACSVPYLKRTLPTRCMPTVDSPGSKLGSATASCGASAIARIIMALGAATFCA